LVNFGQLFEDYLS